MKTKRILSALIAAVMSLGAMGLTAFAADTAKAWSDSADTTWYDTSSKAFTLTTAEQLAGLATIVNNKTDTFRGKTITLGADIDLQNEEWTPIGGAGAPFSGNFDGAGYTISNLYINKPGIDNIGFIGNAWDPESRKEIKNVNIVNADISGNRSTAVLVGNSASITISNCHISGDISVKGSDRYIGGIAGYCYGTIDSSSIKGTEGNPAKITATWMAGGIAGYGGEDTFKAINNNVEYVSVSCVGYAGIGVGLTCYGSIIKENTISDSSVTTNYGVAYTALIVGVHNNTNKTSIIINNTINNSIATNNDENITNIVGADGDNDNLIAGTEVVFDEAGKVTSGKFEVAPPASALNEGYAVSKNDDGSYGVAETSITTVNTGTKTGANDSKATGFITTIKNGGEIKSIRWTVTSGETTQDSDTYNMDVTLGGDAVLGLVADGLFDDSASAEAVINK